MSGMFTADNVL